MGRKIRALRVLALPAKATFLDNEVPLTGYLELHAGITSGDIRSGPVLVLRLGKSSHSSSNQGSGWALHKDRRGACSRFRAAIIRFCCCLCIPCCRPEDQLELQSHSNESWEQKFESEEQMLTIPIEDILSAKAKAITKTSNNESRHDMVHTSIERGTCCGCFPKSKVIPHPSSNIDATEKAERRVSNASMHALLYCLQGFDKLCKF